MTQVVFASLDPIVILFGLVDPDRLRSILLQTDLTGLAQLIVNGTVVGSILALAAVGLTMVYGILRIANFAHGDLLTLGSYLALYFFALLTLPTTLTWGLGLAFVLLALAAADRWLRPYLPRLGIRWIGTARSLSDNEALTLGYAAAILLALVIGIASPLSLPAGAAALLVASIIAVPLIVRLLRKQAEGPPLRSLALWSAAGAAAAIAAHLLIPLQTGPGGFSTAAEFAVGVAVFSLGLLTRLPSPGRDRLAISAAAVAGLVAALLFGTPILLSVALALGGVAVFAVVLERLVWRRARAQGAGLLTLIIISIGLMLALRNTIVILWGTRQRAFPETLRRGEEILGTDILITPHQALAVTVALLAILLLHLFLRHARIGKAMRALADDMELARISGIQVDRVVLYVWIISGALAALAGILYGMVRPFDPNLGWFQLLPIFAAVILGGIGSPYGALLGGFTIGIAMETSPFFGVPTDYKLAVGFGILILVMIFRPRGILGVQATR